MRSLRTRLFVYVVGGAAVLIVVAGVVLRWSVGAWLQDEFDRGLRAKATALAALTEEDGGRFDFDFEPELMPEFATASGPEYFELWRADGTLLARSPSFELSARTRRATLARTPGGTSSPRFDDVALPDGRAGRQIRIDFVPKHFPDAVSDAGTVATAAITLLVARERLRLDADVRRLEIALVVFVVVLTVALAGLTQAALRFGLRSLDRLTREVGALDVTSLGMRIDVEAPPREIAVVVAQVNALLRRLEESFKRERQLSSDIAHELKTPVAELRSLCEVGARWPEDRAAVREFFEDAQAIALQMERIVGHLLALARYDEGREQVLTRPTRVADVVEAAWKPLAQAAADKRLEYRQRISPTLAFDTDPEKFQLMVGNILSNAVSYSVPGTTIACTSDQANGRAAVTFSNRAANLERADLTVMFDRFWRKEQARAGGRNVGLGLALVRALADLLTIDVETSLEPDKTFRMTLYEPVHAQNLNCTSTPMPHAPALSGNAAPGKK